MPHQDLIRQEAPQVPPYDGAQMAQGLGGQRAHFLVPLVVQLDVLLDKRLVRTFLQTIEVIIPFRDRAHGLLLSEWGGSLDTPDKAPAGTKRLSHLLHASKWGAWLIARFLWQRATQPRQQGGEEGLVIWDESGWEKAESRQLEGFCAVRSSKAARLNHLKPGDDHPPSGPIFVPGLNWLAVLLGGRRVEQGPPRLASRRWWSSRGPKASSKREEEAKLLVELAASWGRQGLHVFEQGFAGSLWVGLVLAFALHFVLRWRGDSQLLDAQGHKRKAWKIAQGQGGWSERTVGESRRAQWIKATVLGLPVRHPDFPAQALSLLVCRSKGRPPWSLLTHEPVLTAEQAWQVVFA
jgi:hypothetical protein